VFDGSREVVEKACRGKLTLGNKAKGINCSSNDHYWSFVSFNCSWRKLKKEGEHVYQVL